MTAVLPLHNCDRVHATFAVYLESNSIPSYPSVTLTRQQWDALGNPVKVTVTIEKAPS